MPLIFQKRDEIVSYALSLPLSVHFDSDEEVEIDGWTSETSTLLPWSHQLPNLPTDEKYIKWSRYGEEAEISFVLYYYSLPVAMRKKGLKKTLAYDLEFELFFFVTTKDGIFHLHHEEESLDEGESIRDGEHFYRFWKKKSEEKLSRSIILIPPEWRK